MTIVAQPVSPTILCRPSHRRGYRQCVWFQDAVDCFGCDDLVLVYVYKCSVHVQSASRAYNLGPFPGGPR